MTMTARATWKPAAAIVVGLLGIGLTAIPAAAQGLPAGPSVWQRVTATGVGGSATVKCPDGLAVYGVGGASSTGSAITGIVPSEDLSTATAITNDSDAVTVHAVCGPALANLHRVTATGTDGTATAKCPKTGELQGVGMKVDGDSGASLLSLEPDVNTRSARVKLTAPDQVQVYAICGGLRTHTQVARATESAQGFLKIATVQCPSGTHVQASSASITEPTVVIDRVTPSADLTSVTVVARSQVPGRWFMDATAICG